jgi:trimeric autotransporter adhesin
MRPRVRLLPIAPQEAAPPKNFFPLLAIVLISLSWLSSAQDINTVAGGGPLVGSAKPASITYPAGVVRDVAGNTYISSNYAHCVYKLDTKGNLTLFAGLGYADFSGDGGPATQATLNTPGGLVFDKAGNLYIGDAGNNRIRMVNTKGTIATIAGDSTPNMYYQGGYSGDGGPATLALLNSPYVVSIDTHGNLLIADYKNNRIRQVNLTSGIITTVAGNGTAGYSGDGGPATKAEINSALAVTADSSGGFYVADSGNNVIRHVNGSTHKITTVAGDGTGGYSGDGGPATKAELSFPNDVVVDALGDLYIVDTGNNRVRRVLKSNQIISTIAGNGTQGFSGDGGLATKAEISDSSGAYLDNKLQQLLLADSGNQRVRVISSKDVITTLVGGGSFGDGGTATSALLGVPGAVALDGNGNLFIAEQEPPGVREVSASGTITTVAGGGSEGFSGDGGPATKADFFCVSGLAVDGSGNLFIADTCNQRVRRVDHASHVVTTFAGNGSSCAAPPSCGDGGPATQANLSFPTSLATDKAGNVYIADVLDTVIRMVNANTGIITTVAGDYAFCSDPPGCGDGGSATEANLSFPYGVAVDRSGNIVIADTLDNEIRRVDASTGIISTIAFNSGAFGFSGDGGPATQAIMSEPLTVSVDSSGNVYIGGGYDGFLLGIGGGLEIVQRIDAATGIINTVAGQENNPGTLGFAGDGGPATSALLNNLGVTADNAGGFYIADAGNDRVRKVGP